MAVVAGWLSLGSLLWLVALWYRRETLLADRIIAKSYGRNALLKALPKLWAAQRMFGKRWHGMAREVWKTPQKANFYTQFLNRWNDMPDGSKEKRFREAIVGFQSLLNFEPIFEDRVANVAGIPNKLTDDRPAAILLPHITELGAEMARSWFGIK